MNKKIEWKKTDEWHVQMPHFAVVVKHWTEQEVYGGGPHRWGVYAYIYPTHKIFDEFKSHNIFDETANKLPLHGGPSLFRCHWNDDGKSICSLHIGADYNHYGDESYTFDDKGDRVMDDAAKLVRWLEEYGANESA